MPCPNPLPSLTLLTACLALAAASAAPSLRVVTGVTERGEATEEWLAMLRKRLPPPDYERIAPLRKPLTGEERAWAELVRSRAMQWPLEIPGLAEAFQPVPPPQDVLIVLGNRGGNDAFTHDATTIGFDLSAMQGAYGDAGLAENRDRIDRFFRHEYVHLLQKAWWREHSYSMESPQRLALAEIWAEGLGNYYSLSERWRTQDGRQPEVARRTLASLEPIFANRLLELACASPERAAELTAELSNGPFERKWGALPAALWLEREASRSGHAIRRFVTAGPDGVWELARRHLAGDALETIDQARTAGSRCTGGADRGTDLHRRGSGPTVPALPNR